MAVKKGEAYVLGLDYGSDSCRAVLIDASDGSEAGGGVMYYPRWAKGLYCDPAANQFRQHPRDYIDTLEGTVKEALAKAGKDVAAKIKGIAIDTTGSTPCAVDATGTPLAMLDEFAENPSAMFVLWKDHTAIAEAAKINKLAKTWGGEDYTKYEGGTYSTEWFWSKILRVFAEDKKVAEKTVSVLEHCDWMTALLTGTRDIASIKHSRCAMGHKAMWHADFGGYPSEDFLSRLDPRLVAIRKSLGTQTYTSDQSAGGLSQEWASRLGLPAGIPVAMGAYDAHMGAVGGGVREGWLIRVMGTSTCDVIVAPKPSGGEKLVNGICGQVDGSVVPGMLGYEAGQSAFGDVYAWFKKLIMWPIDALLPNIEGIDAATKEKIAKELSKKAIPELEKTAAAIDPASTGITALDWLNGRRTPDANQLLKGAISGLTLGSDAPRVYRALAEATAFGARAIVERFREEGVAIEGIIGVGGVARKSPFVMQIIADVLNMPISVPAGDQPVALGAAIFAAVVAGIYADIPTAQKAICSPIEKTYTPKAREVEIYNKLYAEYRKLGAFVEKN
ncbi:ribulokinase [Leadbettera azotonutricia]|uniref:Ribulokinase n=1 Tax=Leadbettera azotonutricia (strain ATCC BAA-888 / DSM 13862 / ZAS-9) TaxID=545695 RepID=F5YC20_LEAAZ|nr:ribulokinase [Leadbettera azotonutricia]AEF82695.1 ribulokinase [Leadbettera azotonutricia ZAS-9]